MAVVICPKCNKVIYVPDNYSHMENDCIICCNEVIDIPIQGFEKETENDAEIFFNELENPSEPNEALKKAATRYKKRTDETHDCKDDTPDGVCGE